MTAFEQRHTATARALRGRQPRQASTLGRGGDAGKQTLGRAKSRGQEWRDEAVESKSLNEGQQADEYVKPARMRNRVAQRGPLDGRRGAVAQARLRDRLAAQLEHRAVPHPRWARGLTGPAAETQMQLVGHEIAVCVA